MWRADTSDARMADGHSRQSCLALGCAHWQAMDENKSARQITASGNGSAVIVEQPDTDTAPTELTHGIWARLTRSLRRSTVTASHPQSRTAAQLLQERSGVGAGTEPCFACQGRIANLGALVTETVEGDKQTFSLWRCRTCFTYYVNRWIDRWERLDNLETDERYYRIAPDEALSLFVIIAGVAGGDHPGARATRNQQRDEFERFLTTRTPLSHHIKQGR